VSFKSFCFLYIHIIYIFIKLRVLPNREHYVYVYVHQIERPVGECFVGVSLKIIQNTETYRVGKVQSSWMLHLVVHIATTGL